MNKKAKVLLITEGNNCEYNFFKQIESLFKLQIDIICVRANIYALYNRIKDYDFSCDLKKVLLEILPDDKKSEYKCLLQQKFAYIYLVFDLDCQHHEPKKQANIIDNLKKISEILKYFNDETENGKLYINYPMMESFRDIDSFDDKNYISSCISITNIKDYKSIVSSKKLHGKDISTYDIDNFVDIFKLNINKLFSINKVITKDKNIFFELTKDKNIFFELTKGINIYNKIKEKIDGDCKIYILNTSVFFLSGFRTFNDKYLNSIFL